MLKRPPMSDATRKKLSDKSKASWVVRRLQCRDAM